MHHPRRPSTWGQASAYVALLASAVSAGAHIAGFGHLSIAWSAGSVIMAAVCMGCSCHLITHASAKAWATTAIMSIAMLNLHLPASPIGSGHTRSHLHRPGVAAASESATMHTSISLLLVSTAIELLIAVGALWVMTSNPPPELMTAKTTVDEPEPETGRPRSVHIVR